jgi:hypothetical protein
MKTMRHMSVPNFGIATLLATAGLAAAIGATATPASATVYSFGLGDHPDGNQAPPLYGLRLDELINASAGHDVYTFTFGAGAMKLDYDDKNTATGADDTIRIHGSATGGRDTGPGYVMGGNATIDFTYRLNIADPVDLAGAADSGTSTTMVEVSNHDTASMSNWIAGQGNTGTIILEAASWGLAQDLEVHLVDKSNGQFSFRFNNTEDHRFPGAPPTMFVGWGWLNHDGGGNTLGGHVASSDWLFTATYESSGGGTNIPEPAALALFGAGLAGLGLGLGVRRRRR